MKKIVTIILFLCILLLQIPTAVHAQNVPKQQTVTYCSPQGVPLPMDIYVPSQPSTAKMPVVMNVHGGGFTQGNRAVFNTGVYVEPSMKDLLAKGFIIASIDYRLAPQYKFPAFIEDTKCAIRYLRANAATYNLDPERIGIIGDSAGGLLVSLAGLAGKDAGWDTGEYAEQSSTPQAVVDLYAYTSASNTAVAQLLTPIAFGNDPQLIAKASPINRVPTAPNTAPPFLILHGDKDTAVPVQQSIDFHNKLQANGQQSSLIIVKNGEHGFPRSSKTSPSFAEVDANIVAFFEKELVQKPSSPPLPQNAPSPSGSFFHCLGPCPSPTLEPTVAPIPTSNDTPTPTDAPPTNNQQFLIVILTLFLKLLTSFSSLP